MMTTNFIPDLMLVSLLKTAGFPTTIPAPGKPSSLEIAFAIVHAESAADANNVTTGNYKGRDRGLFQINSYWHSEVTDAQAFDPLTNCKVGYRISNKGTYWSQWNAYTMNDPATGKPPYVAFLKQAHNALYPPPPLPQGTTVHLLWVQPGSTNSEVKSVQHQLNYHLPATLKEDGIFGPVTQSKYSLWQKYCYPNAQDPASAWDGRPGAGSLTKLGLTVI